MKKLLFAFALLALSFTAKAQVSTNIVFTIKVVDGQGTNQVNLSAPANYVSGFVLAWNRNIANNGTNAPSFLNFVKQETSDRLKGLNDDAVAQQIAVNKVASAAAQIATVWPNMSNADQTNIAAIFSKYVQ